MRTSLKLLILTTFFAQKIEYENNQIKLILETPVFNVKKKTDETETKEEPWNMWNLIPNVEHGYQEIEHIEYEYKMLCYTAANGIHSEMKQLYEECSLVEIWEIIMLKKAYNWSN